MFEIIGEHVSKLDDEGLRTLVSHLCEAELRQSELPISSVTSGGHQDARDKGIDVRVNIPISASFSSMDFIPRSNTGFQIKKTDMPARKIALEICPKGDLRQAIKDLASSNGAYIIVSSQGSTTDSTLANRRKAMRIAIGDLPNGANIHLDFYDRERLASWVRTIDFRSWVPHETRRAARLDGGKSTSTVRVPQ